MIVPAGPPSGSNAKILRSSRRRFRAPVTGPKTDSFYYVPSFHVERR